MPGIPILRNRTRGTRGTSDSQHGATPTPCQRAQMCYAEPNPPRQTEAHHSTSRIALTIQTTILSTATQARHPHDPQNTARYGARQAGRHKHEHRTTELEQHPGAPMGSTGTRQGGQTGPCHRRGVYI